jgi:hypothetical protein
MVVSAGADGTLAIQDPRASQLGLVAQVRLSNFPYSLAVAGAYELLQQGFHFQVKITGVQSLNSCLFTGFTAGGLALVGLGDGSVWFVECATGKVLYCLGANQHGVRSLEATCDRLVASGDDGKALLFHFD